MLGATDTPNSPDTAPAGIVMVMDVSLHVTMGTGLSLSSAALPFTVAPKPEPVTTTWLPIDAVEVDRPVIAGAVVVAEVNDTLSKFAVALRLLSAMPMYTSCTIVMVWVVPTCVQ